MSRHGMAATSHPLSTLTAVNVLQAGGNAMDAAIAACAVQCVVEPGSTGIGGDCFALFAPHGEDRIIAFNGSGRAPAGATLEACRAAVGSGEIPRNSPFAVTVPGAIDAWEQLLRDHGTRSLAEMLQPAIRFARDGYPISERVHFDWARQADFLRQDPNARRMLLVDDRAPEIGSVHRQEALAVTLERIAAAGRDAFYTGPIAKDMVRYLNQLGGPHTLADFANARGEYVQPIRTSYRGYDVVECPPNGQGIIALLILNVLSALPIHPDPLSSERYQLEIEASRLAYSVRDAVIGDPDHIRVSVEEILSEPFAQSLRSRIAAGRPSDLGSAQFDYPYGSTVYISVVDKDRNAASFINSLFDQFGSGLVAPVSGVLLHDRGIYFSLEPGHVNAIGPGKRPLHTIIPAMLVKDGRVRMSFGVMGGDYQAIGHASFLSKVLDYGMDMQSAMSIPRVFPLPGTKNVEIELSLPSEVLSDLQAMGYELIERPSPIGGAQAIAIDWENDVLSGASDPRKDGCAIGY
jgi:gamma-glutamyltranspeptidase / glutathione hydrolase